MINNSLPWGLITKMWKFKLYTRFLFLILGDFGLGFFCGIQF